MSCQDIADTLRTMANSPAYAMRRGVLLVAVEHLEAFKIAEREFQANIQEKDELIFAYNATRTPIIDRTIINLRITNKELREALKMAKINFTQVIIDGANLSIADIDKALEVED